MAELMNVKSKYFYFFLKGRRKKRRKRMEYNVSVLYDVADFQHESPCEVPNLNLK